MKILLGLLIFIFFSISVFGQQDCAFRFSYKWTIDSETNSIIDIGLPTTDYLAGYTSDNDEDSFSFVKLEKQETELISHMSSEFCMDNDRIIDEFFKGDNSFYLLKLRTTKNELKKKYEIREMKIPIDSITITFDKEIKQIIIGLPTIRTDK